MNKYGTAIVLTGLSIMLTSKCAIALETSSDTPNTCDRITDSTLSSTNTNIKDNDNKVEGIFERQNTIIAKKSNSDNVQASFWWAARQFDPFKGKLVEQWVTRPELKQVNLIVNWQLWSLLDYFARYRFVNQFGTVARKSGYSLNIFNQEEQCLASYKYNRISNPPKWQLDLEKFGRDSLPIKPQFENKEF